MKPLLRVYRRLLIVQLQVNAQYRVQSVLWMLFAIIRPVVFLAAWSAAAEAQGGSIGDYDVADFAAYYVCLTLVTQLTLSWVADEFEHEVREGRLSAKLLRPFHPLHYSLAENIVYKFSTLPMLLPALVLIAWTFNARFQTEPWNVALFVPSVILAAALRFVSSWCMASLAFWTTRLHSIMHLYDRLTFLFAGQIAPLSLLPGPLATLAYLLPFAYMLWAPCEILRGGVTVTTALAMLAAQAIWLAVFWLGFVAIWRVGLRQFSAVGA
jgi:viologen exporter family transport system permease protein